MNLEEQAGGQLYTNLCLMPKRKKEEAYYICCAIKHSYSIAIVIK